jgi:hypothetical protein
MVVVLHEAMSSGEQKIFRDDGRSAMMLELVQAALHLNLGSPRVRSVGGASPVQDLEHGLELPAGSKTDRTKKIELLKLKGYSVDNRYLIRKVEFLVVSIQLQSTSN